MFISVLFDPQQIDRVRYKNKKNLFQEAQTSQV